MIGREKRAVVEYIELAGEYELELFEGENSGSMGVRIYVPNLVPHEGKLVWEEGETE